MKEMSKMKEQGKENKRMKLRDSEKRKWETK